MTRASLARCILARLEPDQIDELVFGCVLPAGLGQAPARQAALGAGLPLGVGATTVNKMCGSGMKAAMLAHDLLSAGSAEVAIAGGMESMTNAPYLIPKARGGYRIGHGMIYDHMMLDGLELKGRMMIVALGITTEAMVAERPRSEAAAAPGGGMGGMGGMDY